MKKKIIYSCIIVFALGGAWLWLSKWNKTRYLQAYGLGHGLSNMYQAMSCIYQNIFEASVSAPHLFMSTVGDGLMVTSTNLPEVVITNAIYDASQLEFFNLDMWNHPYNISIVPFKRSRTNVLYNVEIWSNGPNGKNENRGGDDFWHTNEPLEVDLTQLSE